MTKEEQKICFEIEKKFPDMYDPATPIPKAYGDPKKAKAIIIGADPTYISGDSNFEFVFGLEEKEKSPFFRSILNSLKFIGLGFDDIYVQNLVRNHCTKETSKNKQWLEMANCWTDLLKKELDEIFPKDVHVFVTAWIILKALTDKEVLKQLSPNLIYTECRFIKPNENELGRTIIPIFRHWKYSYKKWPNYNLEILEKYLF